MTPDEMRKMAADMTAKADELENGSAANHTEVKVAVGQMRAAALIATALLQQTSAQKFQIPYLGNGAKNGAESDIAALYARIEVEKNITERRHAADVVNAKPTLGFGEYRAIALCLEKMSNRARRISEGRSDNECENYDVAEMQGLLWLTKALRDIAQMLTNHISYTTGGKR